MVATWHKYSGTDPAGRIAGLLLAAMMFCVPAARAEGPVAGEGLFITVRNPITSDEMSRVKEATEEARRRLARVPRHQGDARLKIVYDFNPDNRPGDTSLYGPCRDLAKYLLDLHDVTTIAYVHARVSRHTILPVLACHELVMSPGGAMGNDKPDPAERYPEDVTQFYKDDRVQFYDHVARQRGRSPAIVLKMLDPNMEVVEGLRNAAVVYVDRRLPPPDGVVVPLGRRAVEEKGGLALLTPAKAQTYGMCQRLAETRQEVAAIYDLPLSSLREDPLQGRTPIPWRLEVRGVLSRTLQESVEWRVNQVIGQRANFIILDLECGGGDPEVAGNLADFFRTLKDTTGQQPVKTIAYLGKEARDNAAILALGCSQIVMHEKANLGDFEDLLGKHPNYQNALSGVLKGLAEKQFYDPVLLQAMVNPQLSVYQVASKTDPRERRCITEEDLRADREGKEPKWVGEQQIKPRGDHLKLRAEKAKEYGLAQHVVKDLAKVYEVYGIDSASVQQATPGWLEKFARFLRTQAMTILLVVLGITSMILELKLTGAMLPGILSLTCFILFFWAHWELPFSWLAVLLFLFGLVLVGVEIFVVPGVAVLGVSGIVLIVGGLTLATLERWPQTESAWLDALTSLGRFGFGLIGAFAVAMVAAHYLPNIPYANRLMLAPPSERAEAEGEEERPEFAGAAALLGAIGVAATPLRPAGMVRFGDDYVDVVAEGSYVPEGARVQVIEVEGNRIVVKEVV